MRKRKLRRCGAAFVIGTRRDRRHRSGTLPRSDYSLEWALM
ncbi:hypothetical protein ATSB10_05640 [Dyella thiooxydans]|uniref:Uncharacterized protein n=1 Tax=Dyella thiooxydans TaxID=445710 RepID=A0A160MYV2_9GAMM|nr:hypothetical protein ATSB10_05640 [Dyella thiooxydans]